MKIKGKNNSYQFCKKDNDIYWSEVRKTLENTQKFNKVTENRTCPV